jgi:hypothetical protein
MQTAGLGFGADATPFNAGRHPRDRLGEFAKASAAAEYDRLLKSQRAAEGMKAALRDPTTGAVYTGLTHADAFKKAPPDVQARLREYVVGGNFDRTTHAGFIGPDGKWLSRYEASQALAGANGGKLTAEVLNGLRSNPEDLIRAFHAADVARDCAARLALDKAMSARTYDSVGRLHVAPSPISKATVNPYLGKEIPRWRELGLDPNRIYQLLRHPDELKKAAPTFNNLPVLREHVPVTAEAHRPEAVVGSTGTDAKFEHPYLSNSFVIWARDNGIDNVENQSKRALSCGYSYDADMTPGVFEGQAYDGVMRNIKGNHLALVKDGRAGPEIIVGDSMETIMSKTALTRSG